MGLGVLIEVSKPLVSKMVPQNAPKMVQKWFQNSPKMVQKWSQNSPKLVPLIDLGGIILDSEFKPCSSFIG